jgi:hypothetical protein
MTNPTAASSGKFSPAFFKRRRPSKARSLGRRRNGEISLRRLLFAKLFLCACAAKEKADYRLLIRNNLLNVSFVSNLQGAFAPFFCLRRPKPFLEKRFWIPKNFN